MTSRTRSPAEVTQADIQHARATHTDPQSVANARRECIATQLENRAAEAAAAAAASFRAGLEIPFVNDGLTGDSSGGEG